MKKLLYLLAAIVVLSILWNSREFFIQEADLSSQLSTPSADFIGELKNDQIGEVVGPENLTSVDGEVADTPVIGRNPGFVSVEIEEHGNQTVAPPPKFLAELGARMVQSWEVPKDHLGPQRTVRLYNTDFQFPLIRSEEVFLDRDGTGISSEPILSMVGDHLIVMPKKGVTKEALRSAIISLGYSVRETPPTSPFLLAAFDPMEGAGSMEGAQQRIEGLEDVVASVEPDHLQHTQQVPNDGAYLNGTMWGLSHFSDYDIDAREAWERRTSAANVVVAILDTGILEVHEDLADNMWVNPGEIPDDGIDNDNNGWIDDIHGANFINASKSPRDDNGHGTHVAGTIGGVGNNSIGVTGIAWDVKLMSLKFLSAAGPGATSGAISGVYYAVSMGADVINGSFGAQGIKSKAFEAALQHAYESDVIFVAAAGNDSSNNDQRPYFPANIELNNLVSVASHRRDGELSSFSNYGLGTVDLSAPGESIWSTSYSQGVFWDGAPPPPLTVENSSYRYASGTSMAAPHVSGALALLRAEFPNESANELINRLYASVKLTDATRGKVRYGGIVSVGRAINLQASPVIGDAFDEAIDLSWPYAEWTGGTVGATVDPLDGYEGNAAGNGSIWFEVTSEQDGWMKLDFDASSNDGWVAVFRDSSPGSSSLLFRRSGQGAGYFKAEQGATYKLRVDSSGDSLSTYNLKLQQRAANDNIDEAFTIDAQSFSLDGFNYAATHQPSEPRHGGVGISRSVWYRWTAENDGYCYLHTRGSEIDTVLAVYTREGGVLAEVASDDDGGGFLASSLRLLVESGQEYFIAVDSFRNSPAGTFKLNGGYQSDIQIFSQPGNRNAKIGDLLTISVRASSGLPLSYQWYRNGNVIAGANTSTLRFSAIREEDFASYFCLIRNDHTSVESSMVSIIESKSPPEISWQSSGKTLATGAYAEFAVRITGSRPLTYQWKKNGVDLPGATDAVLGIPNVVESNAGIYEVVISNSEGTRTSRQMVLSIIDNPLESWIWRNPQPQGLDIECMILHDGTYYAVATGTKSILLTSRDGSIWQSSSLPSGIRVRDIVYGNGQFVAIGQGSGSWVDPQPVLTSPDGITWTKHLVEFPALFYGSETPQSIEF
ncbi:MAG: S8 family serine peptidase, partial [Opitutales bacterium]